MQLAEGVLKVQSAVSSCQQRLLHKRQVKQKKSRSDGSGPARTTPTPLESRTQQSCLVFFFGSFCSQVGRNPAASCRSERPTPGGDVSSHQPESPSCCRAVTQHTPWSEPQSVRPVSDRFQPLSHSDRRTNLRQKYELH